MLLTKIISIKPFNRASYYESKGYILFKHKVGNHKKLMVPRNYILEIKTEDLIESSNYKIDFQCDNCGRYRKAAWSEYRTKNKINGDLCQKCSLPKGENHINFGKKLPCGFKSGKENYSAIHFKGKNNPNYNSNLTDLDRLEKRDLVENINWRKSIFKRDNYKCTICNKKQNIVAHHLNSYSMYKDKRFDLNNGVTLCVEHHKDYHSKFGYKKSIEEKYKEYINQLQYYK